MLAVAAIGDAAAAKRPASASEPCIVPVEGRASMAPAMALAEADGLLRGLLVTLERRGLSSNPVSFVLGSPQRPFDDGEISALKDYVDGGGS